jgi:thymidylate kinase
MHTGHNFSDETCSGFGKSRIKTENKDRIESENSDFHENVYRGYILNLKKISGLG